LRFGDEPAIWSALPLVSVDTVREISSGKVVTNVNETDQQSPTFDMAGCDHQGR
jgi:hypothetical protein